MTSDPVRLVSWQYLGGDTITLAGSSIQVTTLPDDCDIVELRPNGDDLYYEINNVAATTDSPGFVADGGAAIIGPLSTLTRLDVLMASGTCHIQFYKQEGLN